MIIPGETWLAPLELCKIHRCFRKRKTLSFTAPARVIKPADLSCIELSPLDSCGSNSSMVAWMAGKRKAFRSNRTRNPFISTRVKPITLRPRVSGFFRSHYGAQAQAKVILNLRKGRAFAGADPPAGTLFLLHRLPLTEVHRTLEDIEPVSDGQGDHPQLRGNRISGSDYCAAHSPSMHGHDRGRTGLGRDHTHFQHHLDVPVPKPASQPLPQQIKIVRAGYKLCRSLCTIAAQPG